MLHGKQLYKALDWKPDYLIFTLDALRHKRLIGQILKTGTPKLIVQNVTTPHRAWRNRQPFLYVGFDHALGTQKLAREYIRRTAGKGDYTMLYFTKGLVSRLRGDTFNQVVAKQSDMNLKVSYYTDGDRKRSRESVIETLRRFPNMRHFYACSTDVALGAIDALDAEGLTSQTILNGWGGGDAELKALQDGKLDFTVMRMNDDNGVAMAEAIRMDQEGFGDQVPTIYSGDIELITDETSQDHIDRLINHAFRYSGVPN